MKKIGKIPRIIVLLLIGAGVFYIFSNSRTETLSYSKIPWQFDGRMWVKTDKAPDCKDPLKIQFPSNLDLVTAVLYPGQMRSTGYKSHGGFAFQNSANDAVTVKAHMDGYLVKASRYIEFGELQYFLVFINPCGIMYKLDHLADLSPKLEEAMKVLPEAKADDSRTTEINPPLLVKAGEIIATSVGFKGVRAYRNVTFDLGVMDLRKRNEPSENPQWLSQREAQGDLEYAPYGLCIFELFDERTNAKLRSLPAHDSVAGKSSDYCNI